MARRRSQTFAPEPAAERLADTVIALDLDPEIRAGVDARSRVVVDHDQSVPAS